MLKNCFLLNKINKIARKMECGDKGISLMFVHLYLWKNISKVRKIKDSGSLSNFLCQKCSIFPLSLLLTFAFE